MKHSNRFLRTVGRKARPRVLQSAFAYDPFDPVVKAHGEKLLDRWMPSVPDRVKRSLDRAGEASPAGGMTASGVNWRDVLTPRRTLAADGTQISNATTETIMCPDFTFAADVLEIGDIFKYTLLGSHSTVITTPGTITPRIRWGGVSGTALTPTSPAFAPDPTAGSTSLSHCIEWYISVRAVGSAGSMFVMGKVKWNDFDDASATTLKGNLDMGMIPVSAPAAVGSLDTTTAKALSPTIAFSVATNPTNLTTHIAILESLN